MQQLHLVGITTELDGLIFSARRGARSGSFVVPIDAELLDTLSQADRLRREATPPAEEAAPIPSASPARRLRNSMRPESRLTPREMQARLRAGHTIAQVARAAGVDEEWVDVFAAPILAEQARTLDTALAMKALKPRVGESAMSLAESVRVNLHDKGVPLLPSPEGWSVQTLGDGHWLIKFEYVSRRRRQVAEWELDLHGHELLSRNRVAADIGYVASARRRVPAPPPPAASSDRAEPAPAPSRPSLPRIATATVTKKATPARKTAARKTAARKAGTTPKAGARKTGSRKAATRKTAGRKAPARRTSSVAKRAPARKTRPVAKRAPARKAPARKTVARQAPARKTTARKAAPRKTTARKVTARKTTPRKATPRKGTVRKGTARKGTARKTAARRPATRKAARKGRPAPRPEERRPEERRPAVEETTVLMPAIDLDEPPEQRAAYEPAEGEGAEPTQPVVIHAARVDEPELPEAEREDPLGGPTDVEPEAAAHAEPEPVTQLRPEVAAPAEAPAPAAPDGSTGTPGAMDRLRRLSRPLRAR